MHVIWFIFAENVVGSDVKAVTHTAKSQLTGETTDSDRSLTDKLHYNQLVEQGTLIVL